MQLFYTQSTEYPPSFLPVVRVSPKDHSSIENVVLETDAHGRPHIAWWARNNGRNAVFYRRGQTDAEPANHKPITIMERQSKTYSSPDSDSLRIKMDHLGNPYLVLAFEEDDQTACYLVRSRSQGVSFETPTLISKQCVFADATIDKSGTAHVAFVPYQGRLRGLRYRKIPGNTQPVDLVQLVDDNRVIDVHIADGDGQVYIGYELGSFPPCGGRLGRPCEVKDVRLFQTHSLKGKDAFEAAEHIDVSSRARIRAVEKSGRMHITFDETRGLKSRIVHADVEPGKTKAVSQEIDKGCDPPFGVKIGYGSLGTVSNAGSAAFVVAGSGTPHIASKVGDETIGYTIINRGISPQCQVVAEDKNAGNLKMDVDDSGRPHMIWRSHEGRNYIQERLLYSTIDPRGRFIDPIRIDAGRSGDKVAEIFFANISVVSGKDLSGKPEFFGFAQPLRDSR
ncbi:MAG: hypothetical protein GY854_25665 [Deltaproteobacteria bacterium]|nr:hypothetical protein [Deltaproteobacteria bacterium]